MVKSKLRDSLIAFYKVLSTAVRFGTPGMDGVVDLDHDILFYTIIIVSFIL